MNRQVLFTPKYVCNKISEIILRKNLIDLGEIPNLKLAYLYSYYVI